MAWAGEDALEYWAARLKGEGIKSTEQPSALLFDDPEGLGLELVVDELVDPPLSAAAPDIPGEHALIGFAGARAFTRNHEASHYLLTGALRFTALADTRATWSRWSARGALPLRPGAGGGGTEGAGPFTTSPGHLRMTISRGGASA